MPCGWSRSSQNLRRSLDRLRFQSRASPPDAITHLEVRRFRLNHLSHEVDPDAFRKSPSGAQAQLARANDRVDWIDTRCICLHKCLTVTSSETCYRPCLQHRRWPVPFVLNCTHHPCHRLLRLFHINFSLFMDENNATTPKHFHLI